MASTYTNNLELEKQGAGDNAGTWGDPNLNQNVIDRIDAAVGGTVSVGLTSSNVTLTQTQWRNACIRLTGTLLANVTVSFPLNVNSATVAVGGVRVIDNQCTGNFTVTIKTIAVGSTGVVVPQGVRSTVYSDTANVVFMDDRLGTTDIDRIPSVDGTPNGTVTGVAGTAYKPASVVYDRTNKILYAGPTADGNTGWVPQSGYFPPPQGYLTPVSGTPVITTDSSAATAVYYTPYNGNLIPIYDGSWLQPYFFSEMTLTLTSSQAANQIYDIFAFLDSGTLRIGTGPAWATPTAGSGARGTGAGTTQLSRVNGLLSNAVSMTARNGGSTYSVGANQGTYLGSIFMDATNGQVTCHRSWGQSRKWGIWNYYNRQTVVLVSGDSTATWGYSSGAWRASNGNSSNRNTVFCGVAEEVASNDFLQQVNQDGTIPQPTNCGIGIGINVTTSPSGLESFFSGNFAAAGTFADNAKTQHASYLLNPNLGINNIQCLEYSDDVNSEFFGEENSMMLKTLWKA